jgi:ABC-type transporter Mla MlaB component
MLRITILDTPTEVRLVLEGTLTGPWVAEVESAWEKIRGQNRPQKCVVDLSGTVGIDESGKKLLAAMCSEGARFIAKGVATIQLIKEMKSKCAQQLTDGPLRRG